MNCDAKQLHLFSRETRSLLSKKSPWIRSKSALRGPLSVCINLRLTLFYTDKRADTDGRTDKQADTDGRTDEQADTDGRTDKQADTDGRTD